jgi:S1-C subfamily serine protease
MREAWLARLTGSAREEATRSPEKHLALQHALQELGFGPPGPIDGVYGHDTRAAILAWQQAYDRPVTGLVGEPDALALEREVASRAPASPEPRPPDESGHETPAPATTSPRPELRASGTAFAINTKGEFLTNDHVVKDCVAIRLRIAGARRDGSVIADDERNDLAVVRAPSSSVPVLRFRDGKSIRPADPIVVLGFPYAGLLASTPQVTTGAISALAGLHDDTRYLQITAPVQPGNSGGPLLDLSGNVVGIVSARINALAVAERTGTLPENINFAIKSGIIRSFLEANQIEYDTAPSSGGLEAADVGELAAKSVAFLECYK